MTDYYGRLRTIIGSTASWAANDLIIGDGEIAVERVTATDIKLKVGDGVTAFSGLPYVTGSTVGGSGLTPDVVAEFLKYLP